MQRETGLRQFRDDGGADGAEAAALAQTHPPADGKVMDLLGRWLDLSELERRTFAALIRELNVSSALVESSTLDLSERFQTLATIAQGQMERMDKIISAATTIEVNGESIPLETAMHSVEGVLLKVIETILSISKHAMRMVYALEEVGRDVDGAEACVARIDAINTQTRYLSLNAMIEANRSGEAGAAFRVIAREIKDLSITTDETSKAVRERISSVTRGVRNGHKVLKEIATLDLSEHIMAKERLDNLTAAIMAKNAAFTSVLGETAESSAEMASTIGQLITGMQFQDRTKQHIGAVIEALGVLDDATQTLERDTRDALPGAFAPPGVNADWLNKLLSTQTLGAVKQRLLARLLHDPESGEEAPADAEDDGGDIELF